MKMREWAKATYRALRERPAAEREKHLTLVQVEAVMQASINTLIEALVEGGELRLNNLGRVWVEESPARQIISNLARKPRLIQLAHRKAVRFRGSHYLQARLNNAHGDDERERTREHALEEDKRAKASKGQVTDIQREAGH